VTLVGATLAAGNPNPCVATVTLTAAGLGTLSNSVQASLDQGLISTGTASVTVLSAAPPLITKAFGAPAIQFSGVTTLTLRIDNPNAVNMTNVAFTDTLPAGLIIGTPNGLAVAGCGGTVVATAGSGVITHYEWRYPSLSRLRDHLDHKWHWPRATGEHD
jgi:uncharacterized repeat protein (TIGR01451 family)